MKLFFVLFALAYVALSSAKPQGRSCTYVNGHCFKYCEEGTYSYTPGCKQLVPEATCDVPNPVAEEGTTCDFSSCYCIPPTVRDTVSKKCVKLDECPKKSE